MRIKIEVDKYFSLEAVSRQNPDEPINNEKGLLHQTDFEVFRLTPSTSTLVGKFSFSPLPGCCGVVVSHFTYLTEPARHSGLSQPFRDLKEKLAKELGYSLMIGTTDMSNIPALGNFMKIYHIFKTFTNKRTRNYLAIGYKVL